MKNYKVEIAETRTYTFDVAAATEAEAVGYALLDFNDAESFGTLHHHETGDPSRDVTAFDVTGTDDAPAPEDN